MPPPSHLAIATSSVNRLLKEEASYHKELAQQEASVKSLQEQIKNGLGNEDGNGEFMLKQHQTAVEETKAVFGPLRERLDTAVEKLEAQIQLREQSGAPEQELEAAKTALAQVKAQQNGSS
ncbi:tubulin binding cofactor A [Dactylonectria macrodidyma]|uniref:Tubulin-specific chaperone A n=1 Tax=Dactylonectria macrodidyma TaxID=307937 RepID=A0A9P9FRD7_9HYPO|nr:tubulin binding cofactor A [Dactylonectria macrodidyma]